MLAFCIKAIYQEGPVIGLDLIFSLGIVGWIDPKCQRGSLICAGPLTEGPLICCFILRICLIFHPNFDFEIKKTMSDGRVLELL